MSNVYLTLVVTSIAFGIGGYLFAKRTGRDPVRWTIYGIVGNVLILAVFLIVGNSSQKARQFIR